MKKNSEVKFPKSFEHKGKVTAIGYLFPMKRSVSIAWEIKGSKRFTYEVTKNADWEVLMNAAYGTGKISAFANENNPLYWINNPKGGLMKIV